MQIISYEFHDPDSFTISNTTFGRINLLVGDTGTGKTKFINTLFSLGLNIASKKNELHYGSWKTSFKIKGITYELDLLIQKDPETGDLHFLEENLYELQPPEEKKPIIERNEKTFIFNGTDMPKMDKSQSCIKLLNEEELISPIYKSFCNIIIRRFSQDGLDNICQLQQMPQNMFSKPKKNFTIEKIFHSNLGLNLLLYLLSKHHTDLYNKIGQYYKNIFPFILETAILDFNDIHKDIAIPGKVPVFCIKEKGTKNWIELHDLSSGMQKVLILLTDLFITPEGSIYLIDEYENSLGISAINVFPEIFYDLEKDIQLFITSHHPYIINNIPIKDWFVFHRKANQITIKHGQELIERYGKSKQEAFIKLINDPFYRDGIE